MKITRTVTQTVAVFKAYDTETKEIVTMHHIETGAPNLKKLEKAIVKSLLSTVKLLEIVDITTEEQKREMDIETFIQYSKII